MASSNFLDVAVKEPITPVVCLEPNWSPKDAFTPDLVEPPGVAT